MISIILAEDHHIVRDGLKSLFGAEEDLKVVAEAHNGQEVLDHLDRGQQVDIVLTDMNMPIMGGLTLTGLMQERYPNIKVIILSAWDNEKYLVETFKAGAEGFLLKSVTSPELLFAVRHVFKGNNYICSELTTKFINRIVNIPEPVNMDNIPEVNFSTREMEVLSLLADGLTNQEVADKLFTSKRTVEGYRENMIAKTGVRNTVALMRFAVTNGLVT